MPSNAVLTADDTRSRRSPLPHGVELVPLKPRPDSRGILTEIHRDEWRGIHPVQWNLVRSEANVLRGVHVHIRHVDLLTTITGVLLLGLKDLRAFSPTYGLSAMVRLSPDDAQLAVIPPGVAHGFYFPASACFVYGTTTSFDGSDEFGCRWDDPGLGLDWPCKDPLVSDRDRTAPPLADLLSLPALQGAG